MLRQKYTEIPTFSRRPKPSTGEDGFFAQTLSTPITIPTCRTLRLSDDALAHRKSSLLASQQQPPPWPSPITPPELLDDPDLVMLVHLASPGVCGHPRTAHGGVLATLLDEAMSLAVALFSPEAGDAEEEGGPGERSIRSKMFTAQLDIRYKRPVEVPGSVEVRAKVLAKRGRKVWVRAQIVQGDREREPLVMTDAMAFWMIVSDSDALPSVL